ncbi:MAG: RluA family pseudouridine synthase [Deltaproteobacteria bacterium]|nr:RluA family pseudouridine synthase [Deltaproteobacteria bacterium]
MTAAAFCTTIERANARQRLDRFLTALGTWGSRSQVQRLITEGWVRVDGKTAKPGALLRCGQRVAVQAAPPPPIPVGVEPEAIALDVLYEDDWLLVINKPAGLVVHPAPGNWQGTVVSALLHRWQGRPADLDPLRPGIVHRLDKNTSGALVIAKDAVTLAAMAELFRSREVHKEYLALVWGRLRQQQGQIRRPIGRHPVQRQRMSVRASGRAAVTGYEVIGQSRLASLLRVRPETGRTHQIRVHLAAIGHPIVGDTTYGGGGRRTEGIPVQRQALHAAAVSFRHPQTGEVLSISAPLPDDLRQLLDHLGVTPLTCRGGFSTVATQHAPRLSGTEHDARLGIARISRRASPN